jgi:hypothetical protein
LPKIPQTEIFCYVAELIVVAEEVVVEVMVHFAGLEVCEEVDMSELVNR